MVESLDTVFHALSSEPRRDMLGALAEGERTVGDLASPFDISLAAVSKHLKVLEGAGLVERRVEGRTTSAGCAPSRWPTCASGSRSSSSSGPPASTAWSSC